MKQNTIAQYIFKLYSDSKYYGFLHDSCIEGDMWDEWIAKDVSLQCETLVGYLTDLAEYYNASSDELPKLTKTQAKVWNTFLQPLPEHGMDVDALREIWEKEAIGIDLTKEERALFQQHILWYQEQALQRLPGKDSASFRLMRAARRYARLVQLNAPYEVQINEAKRLAEAFVLYRCSQ